MINNDSIDAQEQVAPLSAAASPQHMAVLDGWKLVPVQPTPEIIAGAAIASWPAATLADIDLARQAAPLVLMQMDMAEGTTVDALAGMLATMAPAYRAMLAAAPKYSPLPVTSPQVVADERELPPLPEMASAADLAYVMQTPEDWDSDYRSTWQKLQVESHNKRQWRKYALELRALASAPVQAQEPVADASADIFDLIREWAHLPEGQRCDAASNIIGCLNRSYSAGVSDGKELGRLSVPVPPVAVPDSWKLVPAEPNDAMQAAGAQAVRIDTTAINKIWTGNAVFRAMLAAAPATPAIQGLATPHAVLYAALDMSGRVVYSHENLENVEMNSGYIKTPTRIVGLAAIAARKAAGSAP